MLLLRLGYYFLMDSIAVSYMKIFILVWILIVFGCVVASMGLLFFDGLQWCFVHEIFLFWYGFFFVFRCVVVSMSLFVYIRKASGFKDLGL